MSQRLSPENILSSFNKLALVIYVEKTYNAEINDFVRSNYSQIVDSFNAKNIDFYYLPYLLQNKDYQAVVNYNRTYLQHSTDDNYITKIYRKI